MAKWKQENENDWIELLAVPLPEDVMKHKWHGDFDAMNRIMDRRLAAELSDVERRRLLLEKKLIRKLPDNYPYTREQVIGLLQQTVTDFLPEEMQEIMDSDYADWIYIQGEPHFRDNVVANLLKTRPDYAARRIGKMEEKEKEKEEWTEGRYLTEALACMKEQGGMDCTIRLHARLWVEEEARVAAGDPVRVYLPIPAVDAQVKAVRICQISDAAGGTVTVAPENAGQRTVCWETRWQPGMTFEVEYEYEIEAGYLDLWAGHEIGTKEPAPLAEGQKADGEETGTEKEREKKREVWRRRYRCSDPVTEDDLSEQLPHIVFSKMLRELTAEVVGDETRPLEKARRIYDYVTTKIHYSYMRSYITLPVISEYVALGHKGDCGAQSILFITMCRIAGIPARWQSGKYANPARVGNHDWARFYVEEYGWLFADCSFGGGAHRAGNEERRRFYFGNLDPFRMTSCRRFQTNFEPPMEKLRSDPYDAQSGEVELPGEEHYRYPWDSDTWMVSWKVKK